MRHRLSEFNLSKINLTAAGLSFIASLSAAGSLYLVFFQLPLFNKRGLLAGFTIWLGLWVFLWLVTRRWILPTCKKFSRQQTLTLIITSLISGSIAPFSLSLQQPVYIFLPEHHLEMVIPIPEMQAEPRSVILSYFRVGFREVSLSELQIDGRFQREQDQLSLPPGQTVTLRWDGITAQKAVFLFMPTGESVRVKTLWDGEVIETELHTGNGTPITIEKEFPVPAVTTALFALISAPAICFALFMLLLAICNVKAKETSLIQSPSKYHWLAYTALMAGLWILLLLVFWPGVFSASIMEDSRLSLNGVMEDWHPILYTWLVNLSRLLFSTPSALLVAQILGMALAAGWGLGIFEKAGVSQTLLWLIAILFGVLPSSNILIITLINDTPYTIAFLALTLLCLKIVLSNGTWLESRKNILILAGVSILVILFRYNGIPAVGGLIVMLMLAYPRQIRRILLSLGIIAAVWLLYNYPLYNLLGIRRTSNGHFDNILLHHISAHISSGTALTPDEKSYLNAVLPWNKWTYSCCSNGEVWYQKAFNADLYHTNSSRNREIAVNLLLRDPSVNINHILCASNLIWKANGGCPVWPPELDHGSLFPGLSRQMIGLLETIQKTPWLNNLVWRPSIYLFLAFFSTAVFACRYRTVKTFLVLAPTFFQSAFLFAVNRVQGFRYQYCVVLVGILLLALLAFFPPEAARKKKD